LEFVGSSPLIFLKKKQISKYHEQFSGGELSQALWDTSDVLSLLGTRKVTVYFQKDSYGMDSFSDKMLSKHESRKIKTLRVVSVCCML